MELWIRSQDKKKLLKATSFELDNDETGIFVNNYDGDYVFAGKYKAKERALEVLDEIQNCLLANFNFNGSYEEVDLKIKGKMINGLYGVIYEMPKD